MDFGQRYILFMFFMFFTFMYDELWFCDLFCDYGVVAALEDCIWENCLGVLVSKVCM